MNKKITILVAEDDIPSGKLYEIQFKRQGWEVIWVKDGQLAVERSQQIIPDIILLDVLMPKLDGFEVLRQLKQQPKTRDIPVVFLSNLGSDEIEVKKGKELGAVDYLIKAHVSLDDIVKKITNILPRNL